MGESHGGLQRHLGLLQATALNVTSVVGLGVFVTIPLMFAELPGPYALLGWLAAGLLILADGLIWSELAAAIPHSGGSYLYLLESYGPKGWGRLMAFLFIWQFLVSGPMEISSGLIAADGLTQSLDKRIEKFNDSHKREITLFKDGDTNLTVTFSPVRMGCIAVGAFILFLLYRRVTSLGWIAVALGFGVLAAALWVLVEGSLNFNAKTLFDLERHAVPTGTTFAWGLGAVMMLAVYNYIGYYNICYLGDEVRDPARTIPRAVVLGTLIVILLLVGIHIAFMGTVEWSKVPTDGAPTYNLAKIFMSQLHAGDWAGRLITLLILGSCFASAFSLLLAYSRIPYGAAQAGHFFRRVAYVNEKQGIPTVSLILVGGLTLLWTLLDFSSVLSALITVRLLVQFVAQIVGLMLMRQARPIGSWPFRMWLYPLPCAIALFGWLFILVTAKPLYIYISLATMISGMTAFFIWSAISRTWPFESANA